MNRIGKSALVTVAVMLSSLASSFAWDTSKNPDQVPSIGWGLNTGKLAGFPSDYTKFTEFDADYRHPLNNYVTLNFDVTDTTLQNVPNGVSTDAYKFGVKVRVYLQDLR